MCIRDRRRGTRAGAELRPVHPRPEAGQRRPGQEGAGGHGGEGPGGFRAAGGHRQGGLGGGLGGLGHNSLPPLRHTREPVFT